MATKRIGDPCERCGGELTRRADTFGWRGRTADAAYCLTCNAGWEIEGEAILPTNLFHRCDADTLDMFTIYDNPADARGFFVVRRWEMRRGIKVPVPREAYALPSLHMARGIIPRGRVRMERNDEDDPTIVETWI